MSIELEHTLPLPAGAMLNFAKVNDWLTPIWPTEEASIRDAVAKRQQEFRAGRSVARRCIDQLNTHLGLAIPIGPIDVGLAREPLWPQAVVGSITHTHIDEQGHCAAIVAPSSMLVGIGLDLEPAQSLSPEVQALVITVQEQQLAQQQLWPMYWEKYLFSAKESFYKCMFPSTRLELDFLDVEFRLFPIIDRPDLFKVHIDAVRNDNDYFSQAKLACLNGFVHCRQGLICSIFWLAH